MPFCEKLASDALGGVEARDALTCPFDTARMAAKGISVWLLRCLSWCCAGVIEPCHAGCDGHV